MDGVFLGGGGGRFDGIILRNGHHQFIIFDNCFFFPGGFFWGLLGVCARVCLAT